MFGNKNEFRTIPSEYKPTSEAYHPNHNDIRIIAGDDVLIVTDDKEIGGLWAGVDNYDPCSGSYQDCFDAMTNLINENLEEACDSLAFKLEEHLYLLNLADCVNTGAFDEISSFYFQLLESKINVFYPIIKHFVEQRCSDKKVGLVNLFGGGTSLAISLICDKLKEDGCQCYLECAVLPFQKKNNINIPESCFSYKSLDNYEEFDVNPFYEKDITLMELFDKNVPLLLQAMTDRVMERMSENNKKNDNMTNSSFDIQRFINAQNKFNTYKLALSEVRNGKKRSHWIWYIFPQVKGLGHSSTSQMYGIKSLAEAEAYLKDETLKIRLYEITNALLEQEESVMNIFGGLDAMKVRSCMTLFNLASPNDVFAKVLEKFYDGKYCERTLEILKEELSDNASVQQETRVYDKVIRPMYTPNKIDTLKQDEVFVFGSNLAGHHAGGAARAARLRFGAIMGEGVGLQGQSYAIPTMQGGVETIKPYVDEFTRFAEQHDELFFYVTRIGCGIAGFKDEDIAPLFANAAILNNVCLPKSFVEVLRTKLPDEVKTIMYGQMRTLVDLLKALNDQDPIKNADDAQERLTELIERNVRYGDEYAFMAVRTIWCLMNKYQHDGKSVDFKMLEKDLYVFHKSNNWVVEESITNIFYNYSVSKLIKYIQFLNDFRRYSDYRQIEEDLPSIPVSHCSSNEEGYYYSFNHYALHDLLWILMDEWNNISRDGHLDNVALEDVVFGRYERMVKEHGIREMIQLAYGQVGCHPDLRGPISRHYTDNPIYGPVFRVRGKEIEKGCSDFRRWPSSSESFEMKFAHTILDNDVNYKHVNEGDYNDAYIPVKDYTLPVYSRYRGKMKFESEEEKLSFIKKYL